MQEQSDDEQQRDHQAGRTRHRTAFRRAARATTGEAFSLRALGEPVNPPNGGVRVSRRRDRCGPRRVGDQQLLLDLHLAVRAVAVGLGVLPTPEDLLAALVLDPGVVGGVEIGAAGRALGRPRRSRRRARPGARPMPRSRRGRAGPDRLLRVRHLDLGERPPPESVAGARVVVRRVVRVVAGAQEQEHDRGHGHDGEYDDRADQQRVAAALRGAAGAGGGGGGGGGVVDAAAGSSPRTRVASADGTWRVGPGSTLSAGARSGVLGGRPAVPTLSGEGLGRVRTWSTGIAPDRVRQDGERPAGSRSDSLVPRSRASRSPWTAIDISGFGAERELLLEPLQRARRDRPDEQAHLAGRRRSLRDEVVEGGAERDRVVEHLGPDLRPELGEFVVQCHAAQHVITGVNDGRSTGSTGPPGRARARRTPAPRRCRRPPAARRSSSGAGAADQTTRMPPGARAERAAASAGGA